MNKESVVAITRAWVEQVVVGMNLCPFARRELLSNRIRFAVSSAESELDLLVELGVELNLLHRDAGVSTTLLVHPAALQQFADYNEFLQQAEALLRDSGYEGVYQIASFHPDYQFAGTTVDAAENYTNRSPFPMLHLIDEALLESALQSYPDPDQIPRRNITLLASLGQAEMQARLESCFHGANDKP